MKLGIIGGGVVGRAQARCYLEHCEVMVYDIIPERCTHPLEEVLQCDLIFICLPTPQKPDSTTCDLTIIERFYSSLESQYLNCSFVLRSTVPVGTTERLRNLYRAKQTVHSPEFLTSRCANTDAQVPSQNIIGGPECWTVSKLQALYKKRFPGISVVRMTSYESEAVKLLLNSFFAVKIAYFNEARAYCDSLEMDWEQVRYALLGDGRIAHSHTKVPGPDGKRGFGGSCLPKDLANLISCMGQVNIAPEVCKAAYNRNKTDRKE